jgi:hypothetical protein
MARYVYLYRNIEGVRVTVFALEKQCIAYSECLFVTLVILHERRMQTRIFSTDFRKIRKY